MDKIRVAIVGVGNCASSLVQGLTYYKDIKESDGAIGLIHTNLGGYTVSDIEIAAAFDVNREKVGKDLSHAILAPPNNTKIFAKVPKANVTVYNAPVMDGLGKYIKDLVKVSNDPIPDIAGILKTGNTQVLVNYLPVGSQKATEFWARMCLDNNIAMVNCIPVFIASKKEWVDKFKQKNIPIIGDDIKSQVGASIVHRTLVDLFLDRGMPIDRTYQLNVGGNTDFRNMLERDRLISKKISKTKAVTSQIDIHHESIANENVHIGPSDYVPWLADNKIAYIRIEGRHFGDVPMNMEVRLSVEDSPNSAGVVIDAIRSIKIALDRKMGGPLEAPSAYLMKSPPRQFTDSAARRLMDEFIEGKARKR